MSRCISAVMDVPVPPELENLRPRLDGTFAGLTLSMRPNAGGNAFLVFNQHLHLLDARNRSATEARRPSSPRSARFGPPPWSAISPPRPAPACRWSARPMCARPSSRCAIPIQPPST